MITPSQPRVLDVRAELKLRMAFGAFPFLAEGAGSHVEKEKMCARLRNFRVRISSKAHHVGLGRT